MSHLRVAAYKEMGVPIEAWDATVGELQRQNPKCIRSAASTDGSTFLVATEWADEASCRAMQESQAYAEAIASLAKQFDLPADAEPLYLFEGEIIAGKN